MKVLFRTDASLELGRPCNAVLNTGYFHEEAEASSRNLFVVLIKAIYWT